MIYRLTVIKDYSPAEEGMNVEVSSKKVSTSFINNGSVNTSWDRDVIRDAIKAKYGVDVKNVLTSLKFKVEAI